jgi:hypothetical protein
MSRNEVPAGVRSIDDFLKLADQYTVRQTAHAGGGTVCAAPSADRRYKGAAGVTHTRPPALRGVGDYHHYHPTVVIPP